MERVVFDGAYLRATLVNEDAPNLFVTFRQCLQEPGSFSEHRPVVHFTDHGFAHLYVQARWNDWYINPETRALEDAFAALEPYNDRLDAVRVYLKRN